MRYVIALAFALVCLPVGVGAECVITRLADTKRQSVLIFEGTVLKVESLEHSEFATTLKVHRVWKGNTPKETTVYHTGSLDGPVLPEGERRIIFAVKQTASPEARLIRQLGRARDPK